MSTNGTPIGNASRPPRVVIDELVYQKIMHWVRKSNYEVSGLGKVIVEDGDIRVVSAYLLPQKNTSTTTDIEGADVGKLAWQTKDEPGELKFWWHSHVNMNVFWSGTDIATINQLGQYGWFVHTVFNKREETKTAISMGDPFNAMIDNIPTFRDINVSDHVDLWDKEYEEKVTNVVPKPTAATAARFPKGSPHPQLPRYSAEEKAELVRLAALMSAEDENPNFPGLGPDGVYGDSDARGNSSLDSSVAHPEHDDEDDDPKDLRELQKSVDVDIGKLLSKRDQLEDIVGHIEERMHELKIAGAMIPRKMQDALDRNTNLLNEIDDELDTLQEAGFLSPDVRYANHYGKGVEV